MSKANPFGIVRQTAQRPTGVSLKQHIAIVANRMGVEAKEANTPYMSNENFDRLLAEVGKRDLNDDQWKIVRKSFGKGRFG